MRFSTWSSSFGRRGAGRGFAAFGTAQSAGRRLDRGLLPLAHEIRPTAVGGAETEVLDRDDPIRHRVEDRAVVRDEEHGAGIGLERRLEGLAALEVEMVRRLVEHEQVRPGRDDERQREATPLAAGEHGDGLLVRLPAGEEEPPEQVLRLGARKPRRGGRDVEDRAAVGQLRLVLREVRRARRRGRA